MAFCEHCGNEGSGAFCAACGKPRTPSVSAPQPALPVPPAATPRLPTSRSAASVPARQVGPALATGIVFVPWIFSWFTLRKGHSDLAKVFSLGWMVTSFLICSAAGRERNQDRQPRADRSAASSAVPATTVSHGCAPGTTLIHRTDPQSGQLIEGCVREGSETEGAPSPKPEILRVDAVRLWRDYDANEVAADQVYKGKKLLVIGRVASIDKGPLGGIYVMLRSPNQFMNVHAKMEQSQEGRAASLSKGQGVALQCMSTGMTLGSPTLDDCVFQ
jgi:hypothetical protein